MVSTCYCALSSATDHLQPCRGRGRQVHLWGWMGQGTLWVCVSKLSSCEDLQVLQMIFGALLPSPQAAFMRHFGPLSHTWLWLSREFSICREGPKKAESDRFNQAFPQEQICPIIICITEKCFIFHGATWGHFSLSCWLSLRGGDWSAPATTSSQVVVER